MVYDGHMDKLTIRQRMWIIWHTRPGHRHFVIGTLRGVWCTCGSRCPV
jgi:hypothetical protein